MSMDFTFGLVIGLLLAAAAAAIFYFNNAGTPDVLRRIIESKKVVFLMVPTLANSFAAALGYDPTAKLLLWVDAAFGLLSAYQFILDLVHGSKSDGTLKKT